MAMPLLDPEVLAALRTSLPVVAQRTVAAVTDEVPHYTAGLSPAMGTSIQAAVQAALDAFLRRVSRTGVEGFGASPAPGLDAAYALGRGEARSGRTIDALLAAYRVGARAAWREMSATLVEHLVATASVADLAGRVFDYIDELSAASVAGHTDELAKSGRVREQYLDRLGRALIEGDEPERLVARANRANWLPPETLTAVIVPAAQARGALAQLDPRTLVVSDDVAAPVATDDAVLLVPDAHRDRTALVDSLRGRAATVGPARPWTAVATSYHRAMRTADLVPRRSLDVLDSDEHLVALVISADLDAVRDLQAQVLEPLSGLRPSTRDRLVETLRSWLLHQGRRDDVAKDLHCHAQTVRYRMAQLRELYGDRLRSPDVVLQLVVALTPATSDGGR